MHMEPMELFLTAKGVDKSLRVLSMHLHVFACVLHEMYARFLFWPDQFC